MGGSGQDVIQTIAHILGINDLSQLDLSASMGDLGLDSLMGVEIKQALERDYDIVLSMKDIRTLTLSQLKEMVETGVPTVDGSAFEMQPEAPKAQGDVDKGELERQMHRLDSH